MYNFTWKKNELVPVYCSPELPTHVHVPTATPIPTTHMKVNGSKISKEKKLKEKGKEMFDRCIS